ncbi:MULTISPECIES: flagellar biosynthesis protein FliQ [Spongiibacter]|jgi:flagellar biosynthetic protein FliQ|uniref:flagellar biosynthesis protein FliQ n=1 Tax=Spongiibacter TaxID=630749 RepID=UPI0003B3E975|nr:MULTISPECIES: flagellar biosynthesis protein FliQ [Spongiibacter]MAY39672.1 flagellar biosynthetic protein FliQ [Spongiibacter sp.]MBO6753126.1 flagellar biosynthesis protein FliQ [Spongiibacter sp.]MBU72911.1 flagellar biosynthetic protein FliQ [Spongiibacter sp.]|tara:strand:- start:22356 stop:22625 length:270 start_codon:yes stop_codon:yes gene_type:complete
MTPDTVIELGRQGMNITVLLAAPLLLSALAAGLLIGMFQAATQIQDMTLSFIPKLVVLVAVLGLTGPWMLRHLLDYTRSLFEMIPLLVG